MKKRKKASIFSDCSHVNKYIFFPSIPHGRLLCCWQRDRHWCNQHLLTLQVLGRTGDRVLSPWTQGRALCAGLGAFPELAGASPSSGCRTQENILSSLCCAVQWVREWKVSPGPPYYHYLFSFCYNLVFMRRVNCFELTFQWNLFSCKFPFLGDSAILYVQTVKLRQVARVYRNPKVLLVLRDSRTNKTRISPQNRAGEAALAAVTVFRFNIRKPHAEQIQFFPLPLMNPLGGPSAAMVGMDGEDKQGKAGQDLTWFFPPFKVFYWGDLSGEFSILVLYGYVGLLFTFSLEAAMHWNLFIVHSYQDQL